MPYQLTQNPSPLIPSVPQLDGNSVVFPAWRARIEDVLAIQGVLDIVQGKVPRPKADAADTKPLVRTEKGYNPEEFRTDWDTLSDIARSRDGPVASGYPFGFGYPLAFSVESDIRIRIRILQRIPAGAGGYPRGYPRISGP
ncbi:uncharacterized protein PGTG_04298 [Puccinia graminis f. sp. tritici CRL 75-36-700-3]|uniref:Uncharacterized protein n=1 Tax=Puccinia graminis f. sp. tritici (strain CRL 75-36-700-3 / race SCCL) TaxID=418459 RepID=E3K1X3_PUCGT|nr:uncharacterized protein PGTG_04298 [Puccinia graminis f. sp. tritici CRL 75-36-700-3]EFP78342.2 hypothetical protein PGTG_04298 [Puccinia graminis f. sp. tritici CRL 75-36-700-3]